MTGVELIAAERERQIAVEGWTPQHDDGHATGELAEAAASYTDLAAYQVSAPSSLVQFVREYRPPLGWPWDAAWWKPSDEPIRNLAKAGALIAAEIDRLQRAKERS